MQTIPRRKPQLCADHQLTVSPSNLEWLDRVTPEFFFRLNGWDCEPDSISGLTDSSNLPTALMIAFAIRFYICLYEPQLVTKFRFQPTAIRKIQIIRI
jgi:hypothetical protein